MRTVIGDELHHLTFERKMGVGDAIGIAVDGCAEESSRAEIACKIVMPEHDVVTVSSRIRHPQRLQRRAIGNDLRLEAADATEHDAFNRPPIRLGAEYGSCDRYGCIRHGPVSYTHLTLP